MKYAAVRIHASIATLLSLLAASSAQAGAKNAVRVGAVNVIKASDMGWRTIISTPIRSSTNKTLVMNVALECGLYTNTVVKSQNLVSDTSFAFAGVDVRVLIDGAPAAPGSVTFCNRMQQLSATLQGALLSCTDLLDLSTCSTTPETIALLQDTMAANSFNFALTVGSGGHNVEVQARIRTNLASQTGTAAANATIGKGSLTVEEVNLIPDGNIISF